MADRLSISVATTASDHKGSVPIVQLGHAASGFKAYAYQCSLEEDIDGSPWAYGLNNPAVDPQNPDTILQRGLAPKERLGNATSPWQNFGKPGNHFAWVGVLAMTQAQAKAHGLSIDRRPPLEARMVTGPHGHPVPLPAGAPGLFPVIQPVVVRGTGRGSPAPGYYVSTSSAVTDTHLPEWDQAKYVDALQIPYAAWAGWWQALGVAKGDFGLAIRRSTGACSGFLFGDTGTGRVGEVSRRLFETLSPDRNNEDAFIFLVFPKSGSHVATSQKFTDQNVIEGQVAVNVMRLNNVPSNDDAIELLRDASRPAHAKKLIEANTPDRSWPYATIKAALRIYGLVPSSASPGTAPAMPAPPPPAQTPPLIF